MKSLDLDVNQVADLICSKYVSDGGSLSVLKLHKLLYYVESWFLVFFDSMIFNDDFEAWVHGPVCKAVFTRFRHTHKMSMYSEITAKDINLKVFEDMDKDIYEKLDGHIENVLETYGEYSGAQLVSLTHGEDPWIKARGVLAPNEPCEDIISKESMKSFYSSIMTPVEA